MSDRTPSDRQKALAESLWTEFREHRIGLRADEERDLFEELVSKLLVEIREEEILQHAHDLERESAERGAVIKDLTASLKEITEASSSETSTAIKAADNLADAAERMVQSYKDHLDRCRPCTINWQRLRDAAATYRRGK
jgi:actin-like ATPase involved in cell morphogenesis